MSRQALDLDTGLLLALDALLKEPNVTRAAVQLNVTQSALSARLTRLRALLNDPLFVPAPSGRGMVPTPHALALRPELERLLERLTDFLQTATLFEPRDSRRAFRIAATDNPAAILAPDLIPRIRSRAPGVRVAFVLPNKPQILSDLEAGTIDLFVGAGEDGAEGLIATTLFDEDFVTAQRKGHPRGTSAFTIDEFCALDHLLISTSGGHFSGMVDQALAELGRERRVTISIQSYALAPLVLASDDCICTLPRRFLERFASVLDLFAPPLALGTFQMKSFWHPRMRTDPAHRWLRQQVAEAAAEGRHDRRGETPARLGDG